MSSAVIEHESSAVPGRPAMQIQGPAPANATTLLSAIASAAANPATDIDKMERLFAMHEQMVKREAEMAFNAAFAKAQALMPTIVRNAYNEQTRSKYAKLDAIAQAITPIYTAQGFSVSFNTGTAPAAEDIRIEATVMHAQGFSRAYHIDMPPDDKGIKGTSNKTDVHATGSTNSYGRRYLLCMIWNITTGDDNDGNAAPKVKLMDESAKADWQAALESAADIGALEKTWARIATVCTEMGDVGSFAELRSDMVKRHKALTPAKAAA